jgi:hypothetical protein
LWIGLALPIRRTPTENTQKTQTTPTMHLKNLHHGQKVAIVKGKYAGRVSTFLEPAGVLGISARLAITGDSKPYRTLRLTSLEHANPPVPSATTTHSNGSPTVKSVIEKVAEIEELLTSLKLDLEKLSSVSMSQQVSLPKKAP